MRKRLISFAITCTMMLTMVPMGGATFANGDRYTDAEWEALIQKENASTEICEDFDQYVMDLQPGTYSNEDVKSEADLVYPDNYAGRYFDQGDLIMLFTDDHYIDDFTDKDISGVEFRKVDFSYNLLKQMEKEVIHVIDEYGITFGSVDPEINKLKITIRSESQKKPIIAYLQSKVDGFNENALQITVDSSDPVAALYGATACPSEIADKLMDSGSICFNANV